MKRTIFVFATIIVASAGIGIAAFSFAAALALMARVALRPAVMATRYAPGSWIIPIKS